MMRTISYILPLRKRLNMRETHGFCAKPLICKKYERLEQLIVNLPARVCVDMSEIIHANKSRDDRTRVQRVCTTHTLPFCGTSQPRS